MLDFARSKPSRVAGRVVGGVRRTELAGSGDAYALHAGTLGEVPVTVFVAPQGNVVAVEMPGRGPQVLTGLAAAAVLSEVEEAGPAFSRTERASAADAARRIDAMPQLSDDHKATLRLALAL